MTPAISRNLRTTTGVLISAVCAIGAAMLTAGSSARAFVPLVFALVLIALASRYGAGVSLAGSVVAALIFAYFAYAPLGSVRVESSSARANLVWMVLIAVVGSYLLFPPEPVERK
ncbi:MAG TPA: DUF4118 domain-containing protein [Clostridia bacterium]|nr:DUF4118 domain-containing protein [Clostridia bacterium]